MLEEETDPASYRIDITVYIDAPSQERLNEIIDILQSKLMEIPGIHRFDVEE